MELARWIIGFLFAVIVALFAISNRQNIDLFYSPWHAPLELPLYAIGLGLLTFGFLFGTFLTWLNAAPVRQGKRQQNKKIKNLEKALGDKNTNKTMESPPSDFFPALPNPAKK